MLKRKVRPIILQGIYVLLVMLFCLTTYLVNKSLQVASEKLEDNYIYVSNEILDNNTIPVVREIEQTLIRPYNAENVTIGKGFYDHNGSEEDQQQALIFFENTYIQNLGIDYVKEEIFDVVAVLEGVVISVAENDITGKTVQIRHNNEVISVYQSLSEVSVKENEKISQGSVIGKSGKNEINNSLGNHLHFELLLKNSRVNPEEYFDKVIKY